MSFVPIGWSVKTFGEVLSLITNGMNGKQNKEGNGIPVSRIETIADQRVDLSRVGFLAEYDEGKIDKYRLEEGDILFSHINSPIHLGKTALVPSDIVLYHGVNLLRLKCEKSIDPRFFNYYCKYLRALGEFSKNAQHAVNQSSINQKKLKAFELVAPSLEEQKRIADKLDSVLAKVEAAQARLDKIPAILKRFRQSVLAAATSGELTKEWREERQLAYDYQQYTFDEILVELRNGLSAKPNEDRKGTPILRISSVRAMEIDQADIRYLELAAKEIEKYKLKVGDLLFTR
ncbi:MAG: restriction endonuclease subunit S, partial [Pseudomonadota bacterium]|nr:restriction endonuclease subunit S [Pseudomonadota bacterium]